MNFTRALMRMPDNPASGITTAKLGAPDPELTRQQFDAYAQTLRDFGLDVEILPSLPGFGDAHYIEDTAVVMPEGAIITYPGAPSRRGEVESIVPVLARHKILHRMRRGGTLDGGDVLMVGKQFFVGLTSRSNEAGVSEFAGMVEAWGYTVQSIPVAAGLHLKSIVNYVGRNTLTVSEAAASNPAFAKFSHIVLSPDEEYAGNTLWINDRLITPAGYPKTLSALKALDLPITVLDTSEFRKMDGGLTCLSLRF